MEANLESDRRGGTPSWRYDRDGFVVCDPVVQDALLVDAVAAMDRVIAGEYRTGREPLHRNDGGGLWNIYNPHLSDDALAELAWHQGLAAAAMDAADTNEVQVWGVHLYRKDGGGAPSAIVGWHQDMNYWRTLWSGGVFTLWLALEEVTAEMGPLTFVPTSHRWGLVPGGDFHRNNWEHVDRQEWREVSAPLPAGGFSLHDSYTLHASRANTSNRYRRGFVIMYRSGTAELLPGAAGGYLDYLDDLRLCPIFRRDVVE
jgi:ectoine hydroxylase-related dioxygenase (phytanoyl-CoA dioxygenase family)